MTILQDVRTQTVKGDSWPEERGSQVGFIETSYRCTEAQSGRVDSSGMNWLEDHRDSLFEDRSNVGRRLDRH